MLLRFDSITIEDAGGGNASTYFNVETEGIEINSEKETTPIGSNQPSVDFYGQGFMIKVRDTSVYADARVLEGDADYDSGDLCDIQLNGSNGGQNVKIASVWLTGNYDFSGNKVAVALECKKDSLTNAFTFPA